MSEEILSPGIETGEGNAAPVVEPVTIADDRDDVHADVRAVVEALKNPEPNADVRPRGADGKFAAKVEADAPVKAAPVAAKVITDPDTSKASETAPSTAHNAPPVSWSADAKANWATLPPAIQAAVLKREDEASSGIRQKSEEIKRYEQQIAPVAAKAKSVGVDPAQYIQNVLAAEDFLAKDFPSAVKWLAEQYGFDLSTLTSNPAPDSVKPSQPAHDAIAPVLSEINALKSDLDTFKLQAADQSIKEFEKNPDHKHFPQVRAQMGQLIAEGKAATLPEAYKMAVRMDDSLYELSVKERLEAEETSRKEAASQRAAKAKSASVSVRGAPNGADTAPKRGSVGSARDDVRAAFNAARGDA